MSRLLNNDIPVFLNDLAPWHGISRRPSTS